MRTIGFNIASRDALVNPQQGDVFINAITNIEYEYTGKKWDVVGKKAVILNKDDSSLPTAEPGVVQPTISQGDILLDSETGKTYQKKGKKWVETDNASASTSSTPTTTTTTEEPKKKTRAKKSTSKKEEAK